MTEMPKWAMIAGLALAGALALPSASAHAQDATSLQTPETAAALEELRALHSGGELSSTDLARDLRLREVVERERDGLANLVETTTDPRLREIYRARLAELDAALAPYKRGIGTNAGLTDQEDGLYKEYSRDPVYRAGIGIDLFSGDTPSTGIGFQRDGAPGAVPEQFAIKGDDRIDMFGVSGSLSVPGGITISGHYSQGDTSASATIPSTFGSGTVYGDLSPGGSSGNSTPFGLDARIEEERKHFGVGTEFPNVFEFGNWDDPDDNSLKVRITLKPVAGYTRIERDIFATAQGSGNSGGFDFEFSQTRDQQIREDSYHVGLAMNGHLSSLFGVDFGLSAEFAAEYVDSRLDSTENNRNNFTGPPDEAFDVLIRESKDTLGYTGKLGASASVEIAPGLFVGITGSYEYRSDTGTVFNPNSGDQVFFDGLRTTLEHRSTQQTTGSIWLAVPF